MKTLLLILLLAVPLAAQDKLDWKRIKEMSGPIPDHAGLTVETLAAQIARGGDKIKVLMRIDFPGGAPYDIFKETVPWGFDPSSIVRIEAKLDFSCDTLMVKVVGSSEAYQFTGKKFKSKEAPFAIPEGHIFAQYFCEVKTQKPTGPPKLKPPK